MYFSAIERKILCVQPSCSTDNDAKRITRRYRLMVWFFSVLSILVCVVLVEAKAASASVERSPNGVSTTFDMSGQQAESDSLIWLHQFGTDENDYGNGVTAYNNSIYVAGSTYEIDRIDGQESADAFVHGYAGNGTAMWTDTFGTLRRDEATAVFADASGVYVTGYTEGAMTSSPNAGSDDVFVRRYDTDGTVLWTVQSGTQNTDRGQGITAHKDAVYVTGFMYGTLPGQQSGHSAAFVRKYDIDGNEQWTRLFQLEDVNRSA